MLFLGVSPGLSSKMRPLFPFYTAFRQGRRDDLSHSRAHIGKYTACATREFVRASEARADRDPTNHTHA